MISREFGGRDEIDPETGVPEKGYMAVRTNDHVWIQNRPHFPGHAGNSANLWAFGSRCVHCVIIPGDDQSCGWIPVNCLGARAFALESPNEAEPDPHQEEEADAADAWWLA